MSKSILVVDDEYDLRELMSELLSDEGYVCAVSPNMTEALQALATAKSQNHNFDLIISDVNMPGGSGIDLLKSARALGFTTPFLFLSGEAIDKELQPYLNLAVMGYQLKPFRSVEFLEKLKQFLS